MLKPSRYKGAHGGRGSGKSHLFAELLIEEHVRDPERNTVCVREIQKSLGQSVKKLLEIKIESLGVKSILTSKILSSSLSLAQAV